MDGLTRSQLAQRAQVNLETIRFYEGEGLLPVAPRTASGYRKFSEHMIERLAFVKRAKALGFSLEEIRELLHLQGEHIGACAEVRNLLRTKLSVVREKKADLEKLEAHLSTALRKCNRVLKQQPKPAEDCPVLRQMADSHVPSVAVKLNSARQVAVPGRCGSHAGAELRNKRPSARWKRTPIVVPPYRCSDCWFELARGAAAALDSCIAGNGRGVRCQRRTMR